jgi:hypothetical protein
MISRRRADRDAYVVAASGGDESLRREIISVQEQPSTEAFIDGTVSGVLRAATITDTSFVGRRVGAYEITGILGAGGMRRVHRAHDARLGRDVALRVLSLAGGDSVTRLERMPSTPERHSRSTSSGENGANRSIDVNITPRRQPIACLPRVRRCAGGEPPHSRDRSHDAMCPVPIRSRARRAALSETASAAGRQSSATTTRLIAKDSAPMGKSPHIPLKRDSGDNRANLWTAHGLHDLVGRSQSRRLLGTPPALSATAVDAIGGGVYQRLESEVVVPDRSRTSGDVPAFPVGPVRP